MKPFLSTILSLTLMLPAGFAAQPNSEPAATSTELPQPPPQKLTHEEIAELAQRDEKPGAEVAGGEEGGIRHPFRRPHRSRGRLGVAE
jgi:hypothetical protein